MKKIILLLLVTTALSADGFYCAGSFNYDARKQEYKLPDGDYFVTDITAGYEFKGLYAECETVTDTIKTYDHMFKPYSTDYYMRGGMRYKTVYLEYEHLCTHGIDKYGPRASHDRFTIGFDTRGKD